MTSQGELDGQQEKIKFGQFLTIKYLRRALSVSIALHLAQQLSGINGVSLAVSGRERERGGRWFDKCNMGVRL